MAADTSGSAAVLPYASFPSRLMAFSIDLALITLFHFGAAALSGLVLCRNLQGVGAATLFRFSAGWLIAFALIFVAVHCLYTTLLHTVPGQTVGKRVMGIRVVAASGQGMSVGQSALRWCGYWLSAAPCGAGFFWPVVHPERCAWHDSLAATRVVEVLEEGGYAPGSAVSAC